MHAFSGSSDYLHTEWEKRDLFQSGSLCFTQLWSYAFFLVAHTHTILPRKLEKPIWLCIPNPHSHPRGRSYWLAQGHLACNHGYKKHQHGSETKELLYISCYSSRWILSLEDGGDILGITLASCCTGHKAFRKVCKNSCYKTETWRLQQQQQNPQFWSGSYGCGLWISKLWGGNKILYKTMTPFRPDVRFW